MIKVYPDDLPWDADWTKKTRDVDLRLDSDSGDLPSALLPELIAHPEKEKEFIDRMMKRFRRGKNDI